MKERSPKPVKTPWPTQDVMKQVYELKLWGGDSGSFYSGEGSHHSAIVQPYLEAVRGFLSSFDTPLEVCDLGCGDFNVGKELVSHTKSYVAADIVPELIERNKELFQATHLTFVCLDIASDHLPAGDCVILRQVLQHLSNAEVQKVVEKLNRYKHLILTEHLPQESFVPNLDILSGQGIRLKKQSGINLLAAPFDLKVKAEKQLCSVPYPSGKGVIVTTLYEL